MPLMAAHILHICILLLSLCSFLFITPLSLEAREKHTGAQLLTAGDISRTPRYGILYEQLLLLEQEVKIVEALRMIPEVYGAEIPVDSFYITLENKRLQLLEMVSQKEISFPVGRDMYTCSKVRQLFKDIYLRKPESYYQMVKFSGDLDVKRFCYFMVIEGQNKESSYSKFDIRSALKKADPWLVSAAIFISRKQESKSIAPQDIINRWQSLPDLWDEESTQQSLLFLAQFDSKAINNLEINNEDIRLKVETLRPVSKDQGYVAPLMFSAYGEISYRSIFTGTIVQMKENKNKKGVIKRWAGDANHYSSLEPVMEQRIKAWNFQAGAIPVEPGLYKLRFNSVSGSPPSGYYGDSLVFDVKKGELVVIPIALTPAI